ncbi:MAG: ferrochelatase [Nitrospinales bacterium]
MTNGSPLTGVLLMAHGAPNSVDDIPLYLKNIRGGKEPTPEMIRTISERYRAIGGSSPLLEITRGQAKALENLLNRDGGRFRVYCGMRNWSPYIRDAVAAAVRDGVQQLLAVCLAPQYSLWSTERYFKTLREALADCGADIEVRYIASWADHPGLAEAFAERYAAAAEKIRESGQEQFYTVFTAHSIPADALDFGDPYSEEYDKTIRGVVERVKPFRWFKTYQSQGFIPVPWLGPTVESALDKIAGYGRKTVLMAPLGFLCDHIEIIYDIDVVFKEYAASKGLELWRTESLNLSPRLTEALASVVWMHLV